jgi:hypothetical protein
VDGRRSFSAGRRHQVPDLHIRQLLHLQGVREGLADGDGIDKGIKLMICATSRLHDLLLHGKLLRALLRDVPGGGGGGVLFRLMLVTVVGFSSFHCRFSRLLQIGVARRR